MIWESIPPQQHPQRSLKGTRKGTPMDPVKEPTTAPRTLWHLQWPRFLRGVQASVRDLCFWGFRVYGVWGLGSQGFRVWGLGSEVFRVEGFRALGVLGIGV